MRNRTPRIKLPTGAVTRPAHRLLVCLLAALLVCWPLPGEVQAAAGDLDLTFGNGGKVTTDFFGSSEFFRTDWVLDIAIQPDGKIIAAGYTDAGANFSSDFALARYNPDGSLDASFGSGGRVTTDFFGIHLGDDIATALALQPDGRIIAAGYTERGSVSIDNDFGLARYNSDGSLDTSFGTGGKVVTDFAGNFDAATDVVLQPDGKIIAVGNATDPGRIAIDFALARYNPDGSLDPAFGSGGKATAFLAGQAFGVALQPDGKIVASGFTAGAHLNDTNFILARFTSEGSLDPSFGSGGAVATDFLGSFDEAYDLVVQEDGKIVAAGRAQDPSTFFHSDFALARYNPDGRLDPTFGTGGKVRTDFFGDSDESARALVTQLDGKLIAAGSIFISPNYDFALVRYNPDGSLDPTFGDGGKITTDFFNNFDIAYALAIQPDGKIVAAGVASISFMGSDFALARYEGVNFDICIQDDSNGNLLRFNSITGDYQFFDCRKGFTLSGRGTVTVRSCGIELRDGGPVPKRPDRSLAALVNPCRGVGTASLQVFATGRTYAIADQNIANNSCACP